MNTRITKSKKPSKGKILAKGEVIIDKTKHKWIVGDYLAEGGNGTIYTARNSSSKNFDKIIKMEPIHGTALLTESNFYKNHCVEKRIKSWMEKGNLKHLGIPKYINGAVKTDSESRYLIMERYGEDLNKIILKNELGAIGKFQIAINILDQLEYIHSREMSHGDIKASNIVKGRLFPKEIYLIDYGTVTVFSVNGNHKLECANEFNKHRGTLEFCGRDSHKGNTLSRRSDIESLMFNLLQWLSWDKNRPNPFQGLGYGNLPWISEIKGTRTPAMRNKVAESKQKYMSDTNLFIETIGLDIHPWSKKLENILHYVSLIEYDESPKYDQMRKDFASIVCEIKGLSVPSEIDLNEFRNIEWDFKDEIKPMDKINIPDSIQSKILKERNDLCVTNMSEIESLSPSESNEVTKKR